MVVVAVDLRCSGRFPGGPCTGGVVRVGGGTVTYLDQLQMWLEHAREDYQHARTFHSATGVTYTPESIDKKRLRVVELEEAVEHAREASGQ